MKSILAIAVVLVAGAFQVVNAASRTISSYTEASGNQHPGTAATNGPVTVTCTSVGGTNAACFISGPGVAKEVAKNVQVGTSGPGTVTLTCDGSAPLTCQARIDGPVSAGADEKKPDDKK